MSKRERSESRNSVSHCLSVVAVRESSTRKPQPRFAAHRHRPVSSATSAAASKGAARRRRELVASAIESTPIIT